MQSVARCSCENNYIITLKTEYKRLRWKEKQFNHRAQNNILIRQHAAADESADEVTREFWMFFVAFAQLIAMTQRPPGVRVLITRSVCTLMESNGKLPLEASQQKFYCFLGLSRNSARRFMTISRWLTSSILSSRRYQAQSRTAKVSVPLYDCDLESQSAFLFWFSLKRLIKSKWEHELEWKWINNPTPSEPSLQCSWIISIWI